MSDQIITTLIAVTQNLPIGTNLGLLHVLWTLVSGKMLSSRGGLFPALQAAGFKAPEIRRAWAAVRYGNWSIETLLASLQNYVKEETEWEAHRYEGYIPKAVDLTGFWRPKLKNCPSKQYHPQAGKALPAIVMAIIGQVGHIGNQRLLLPTDFIRVSEDEKDLLYHVADGLKDDEIAVLDAGFKLEKVQEALISRYVIRLAKNFTARCTIQSPYKGKGRPPEYGEIVRPLARSYNGNRIEATPPDWSTSWVENDYILRVDVWENLVLTSQKAKQDYQQFTVMAFYDPRYTEPLLVAVPLKLLPASVLGIYRDRWSVEHPPLVAKQMLGTHRQFVFAPESCRRLSELALLAGSILAFLAASLPAIPTGFWDRKPKPTPGRLRRALAELPFPDTYPLPARFRKKASITTHLATGIAGHRRTKQAA